MLEKPRVNSCWVLFTKVVVLKKKKKKSVDKTVTRKSHLGLHCYVALMGSHRQGDISRTSALRCSPLPPWPASTLLQQEHLL